MDSHIEELLPFYALDALTEEEKELVESYLAEHPEARAQVQDLQSGASALPYAISPVEPPREVKKALMARVTAEAQTRQRSSARPSGEPVRRGLQFEDVFRILSFGAATVAILWAFALNAQVTRLQDQVSSLNDQVTAQSQSLEQVITQINQMENIVTVSLSGTDAQPDAQGQLIADPSDQTAVLVIAGLPQLEVGRTYQVWLIDGDGAASAGLLTVGEDENGILVVTSDESIGSFNSLGISIEPAGGSIAPTGEIVVLSEI